MGTMKEELEKNGGKIQEVVKNEMVLRIPAMRKIELTAREDALREAVAKRHQYLSEIPSHMAGLVARIREIQNSSVEEKSIRAKEFRELIDEVLSHLNSEEPLLRNAATQAYAEAMVKTLPPDKRLVTEMIKGGDLPGLIELKILEPAGNAKNAVTLKVFGENYKVNGGRHDYFAIKLAKALSAGAACAAKAAHDQYHGQVVELRKQATIPITELSLRKSGRFFLDVPDVKDGDRFLPGGALLAKSDGWKVSVVQAVGHFQHIMTEITEANTYIPVISLNRERLILPDLPNDVFRRIRILHAVLRRGIAEAQKKEAVQPKLELVE